MWSRIMLLVGRPIVTPDVNSGHEIFLYCHLLCIELPFIESRG